MATIVSDKNSTLYSMPISSLGLDITTPVIETKSAPTKILSSKTTALDGNDPFWGDDISILFDKSRIVEFFPTADQTLSERMNSVTRMVIYISTVLSVYQGKTTPFHFGIFITILIYFMWKNQTIAQVSNYIEPFTPNQQLQPQNVIQMPSLENQSDCILPTLQNPFMNYLVGDDPNRPAACKGPGVQEMAANLLDKQLFSDVDDLFSKNSNDRLFRTMPSTTKIPDTEKYANWLIKGSNNCKEDNQCAPYDDPRMQRQLIPEDLDNDYSPSGFNL